MGFDEAGSGSTMTATIEIDASLGEEVRRLALEQRRSPLAVMNEVVSQYVRRARLGDDFRAEAEASWQDFRATGLNLTGDEARNWLRSWGTPAESGPPDCHD